MNLVAVALDVLFADPAIGVDAVYMPAIGTPQSIRVVRRSPDRVLSFGESRIHAETVVVDVRAAEVPAPAAGDAVEIAGGAFVVQGEPVADAERLVWTLDLRPA